MNLDLWFFIRQTSLLKNKISCHWVVMSNGEEDGYYVSWGGFCVGKEGISNDSALLLGRIFLRKIAIRFIKNIMIRKSISYWIKILESNPVSFGNIWSLQSLITSNFLLGKISFEARDAEPLLQVFLIHFSGRSNGPNKTCEQLRIFQKKFMNEEESGFE